MKKRLVIANWKMNPSTLVEAKRLFTGIARRVARLRTAEIVICPPTLYLTDLIHGYRGSKVRFGAQDISMFEKEGAHTGEVSGTMLKRLGATYVIVGHSERRAIGETNEMVARKAAAALRAGLVPVVCVGERARDENGAYLEWLERQIRDSLAEVPKTKIGGSIVAYEPLWAIGKTAQDAIGPHELHETALFVRKTLVRLFGRKTGSRIRIVYGGSVEPQNDASLLSAGGVDGFLVGHASLHADDFIAILR